MSDAINKEIAILSHLQEIHKLLGTDSELANNVAVKLETLDVGNSVRSLLMGNRAKQPYYTEKCALALQPILDHIYDTKEAWEFKCADNPALTVRTMYLKVYQSWLWLCDKHPQKEKYRELKGKTMIAQRRGIGVRIYFRDTAEALQGSKVDLTFDNFSKLQNEITKFLEQELTQSALFDRDGLSLSEEQINDIKDSLAGTDVTKVIVETSRVRILRKPTTVV